MAVGRRRSTRSSTQQTRQMSADSFKSASPEPVNCPAQEEHSTSATDDTCPACKDEKAQPVKAVEKESWVRCDACKTWFHWRCVGAGGDLESIDKWFCTPCLDADASRLITLKPPARKSSRKRTQRDYANLNSGLDSDPTRWTRLLQGKTIKKDSFKRMKGSEVTVDWLESDSTAMKEPFLVEKPDGLGMKMPPKDLTVTDIAESIGWESPVEVIDVASQSNSPGWSLGRWAEYYNLEPADRDKIRNVISLEISGSKLADKILPPKLVRDLDWVEKFWPSNKRGKGHVYPKVQLYCLMSVAQSWTDWHIDFAGSSVYYHIFRGSKIFYFIRPTAANLAAYERWSGTEIQNHAWLGDFCDEVFKVELQEGNTMIIPTGWIHAVYTPVDSLVFGGNFLHSYNIATQLRVRAIEISTHVPKKFRFPMFSKLCWYAGEKYLRDLKAKEEFSSRIHDSIEALAEFLVSEVRIMERGTEQAKKEGKEQVPSDRVKDAPALARELRWRVKLAAGYSSDDGEQGGGRKRVNGHANGGQTGYKRKRADEQDNQSMSSFRNFKPRHWDGVEEKPSESETREAKAFKPVRDENWAIGWLDWKEAEKDGEGDMAHVDRIRNVVVKVRKVGEGVERERVERILERWLWDAAGGYPSSSTVKGSDDNMKADVVETPAVH